MTESDDKKLLELIDPAIARIGANGPAVDVDAALRNVRARMNEVDSSLSLDAARERKVKPRYSSFGGFRAAAMIFLMFGAVAIWQIRANSTSAISYATSAGESRDVTLADGSIVRLAPGTTLRVAGNFNRERTVDLDGLARFTVTHDASHPFSVRAGDARIDDIGTVFFVRTGTAGTVDVVVTEGSVKLSASKATGGVEAILAAGDRGSVNGLSVTYETGAATDADMAWTSGHVAFENATMDRVQSDLRRFYGVEVVIRDASLNNRHLTTTFGNESIDQIMRTMGLALDAAIERRGDTLFVGGAR